MTDPKVTSLSRKPSSAAELVDFEQQLEQFRGNTLKEMTDEFQDIRAWQQMLFDCEHLLEQRSFKTSDCALRGCHGYSMAETRKLCAEDPEAQALTAAAWESPDFQRAAEVLTTPSSGVRGCPVNPERGHLQALQMAVEWTLGGFDTRPVPEAAEKKQRDRLEILLHYRQPEEEAGMKPRVRMYDYLCDTLFHVPMKIVGPEVVIPEFRDLDGQLVKPVWMEADFCGGFERPKPVFAANRYPYQLPERPGKSRLQQRAQHWLLWYLHFPWEEVADFPDDVIDQDVRRELMTIVHSEGFEKVDYIWYRNPAASVPEVFHVQVFWIIPQDAQSSLA
eukprot:s3648_g2.t2